VLRSTSQTRRISPIAILSNSILNTQRGLYASSPRRFRFAGKNGGKVTAAIVATPHLASKEVIRPRRHYSCRPAQQPLFLDRESIPAQRPCPPPPANINHEIPGYYRGNAKRPSPSAEGYLFPRVMLLRFYPRVPRRVNERRKSREFDECKLPSPTSERF